MADCPDTEPLHGEDAHELRCGLGCLASCGWGLAAFLAMVLWMGR